MTLRVGWFSTGRGDGSRRLLKAATDAIGAGDLDAEIAFLFCNRERGEYEATDGFLDLAESHAIPTIRLSSRQFRRDRGGALSKPGEPLPAWRAEYDGEVAKLLEEHPFDVGVLAGYMLIFTPEMADRYPFLNLHPAEPGGPIGTWQQVIWDLIDARATQSGVMIHMATDELDRGPIVSYCTYPLGGEAFDALWDDVGAKTAAGLRAAAGEEHPLFLEIRRHGAARELPLVIETLRALSQARVQVNNRRVVNGQGDPLANGLNLTAEVETTIAPAMRKRKQT
ncbi:MAG: phosphoglycerate transporter [Chloroflexi bacterium]|nr:phosphoglycerate transporter [Chloroflexota bacterium]